MKKISIFLAVILTFAVLCGCQNEPADTTANTETIDPETTSAEVITDEITEDETEEVTEPVTEPETEEATEPETEPVVMGITDKDSVLPTVRKAFDLGEFLIDETFDGFIPEEDGDEARVPASHENGYMMIKLKNAYDTPEKLSAYVKSFASEEIAGVLASPDYYDGAPFVTVVDGVLYANFLGKQGKDYEWIDNSDVKLVSEGENSATYEISILRYLDPMGMESETQTYTFELVQTEEGVKISGGSYTDAFILRK